MAGQKSADLPALIAVSAHGRRLAERVEGRLVPGAPAEALRQAWQESRHIVFFGATGIATRLAAPLLGDKTRDPALVVVDDAGRYAISLLSGHEGGANDLARAVARQIGAEPVITTASEVLPECDLTLGIGCSKGASAEEIEHVARLALREADASLESVAAIASIDLKRAEPGLLRFAQRWHLPLRFYSAGQLAAVDVPTPSERVAQAVGTPSVAEAAASLAAAEVGAGESVAVTPASGPGRLLVTKRTSSNTTAAVARGHRVGRVSVIGIGPGGRAQLTFEALEALRQAEVVLGYGLYVDLVRGWLPLARCEALPLGEERERARRALTLARAGRRVALVSSGDAGIYALAGLVFEELGDSSQPLVEVVPGVTAASSAAALLGAPLMADFATISLSDLHIRRSVILDRLEAAARSDMVTVLYNPASQRRRDLLAEAHRIFLRHRLPNTPVGLVRDAYRPGQSVRLFPLSDLPLGEVDMFTTVVLGNSRSALKGGRMITLRDHQG